MYAIGTHVYCKSQDQVGTITERNWLTSRWSGNRRAMYIVEFHDAHGHYERDYLTGSADLRRADYICDCCNRWREGRPYARMQDGEYDNGIAACFLCVRAEGWDSC